MVTIQTPNGTTGEHRLRVTTNGLRLEGGGASYHLKTLVMEFDWRIRAARTARARKRLVAAGLLAMQGQAPRNGAAPAAAVAV
jgi:hypothetical protein